MNFALSAQQPGAIRIPEGHYLHAMGRNAIGVDYMTAALRPDDKDGAILLLRTNPFNQMPQAVLGVVDATAVTMPITSVGAMLGAFRGEGRVIAAHIVATKGIDNGFAQFMQENYKAFGLNFFSAEKGAALSVYVPTASLYPHTQFAALSFLPPGPTERQEQKEHAQGPRRADNEAVLLAGYLDLVKKIQDRRTIASGVKLGEVTPMRPVACGMSLNDPLFIQLYK